MNPIVTNMAALAVASLFYAWRAYDHTRQRRQRVLCQRAAYMLWVAAQRIRNGDSGLTAVCRG